MVEMAVDVEAHHSGSGIADLELRSRRGLPRTSCQAVDPQVLPVSRLIQRSFFS